VRVKLAASLDGGTALANGTSQWITGAAARRDVQRWRARASAVLTGIGTVLADDPSLNARPPDAAECAQPVRVILDSALRLPPQARTLGLPGEVLVFTHSDDAEKVAALAARGATVISWPGSGELSLPDVFAELGRREVNEVWVEAGARLSGALLANRLADELVIYLAPQLLGSAARGMFELGELTDLNQRIPLRWQAMRRVGNDLRLHLRPVRNDHADDEG
jgi:diaminohydroxyphosphoribosylaminopyrimidine deaminase/5-amino-6-(5-phosphoribosylamino)uracil reductase